MATRSFRNLLPGVVFFLTAAAILPALVPAARNLTAAPQNDIRSETIPDAGQPQLAVDAGGKIYLVYGVGKQIFFAAKNKQSERFQEPRKVADVGAMALGMRRGPRIAVTDKAIVVTAVDGREGHGWDEDLHAWRSTDGGKTWQGPATVNGVAASAREGLQHLVAAPDGTFFCVWLDLREKGTRLFGASSSDGGESWREQLLYKSPDGSVCQCCQPQAAFDAHGGLHVMWRNDLAGARDMYLMNSKNNGRTFDQPAKLGTGTWPLNACPMDGGGLAADAGGSLTTIWRRHEQLFRCTSGQLEIPLGTGMQGWAANGPGGVYLIWITGRPGSLRILSPRDSEPRLAADGNEQAIDPVIAGPLNGKGPVVAAWEEVQEDKHLVRVQIITPAE